MVMFGNQAHLSFGAWLAQLRPRSGWIGDLRQFAREDPTFPKDGDPDAVRAYLLEAKAGLGLIHAIDDAEIEWMNS